MAVPLLRRSFTVDEYYRMAQAGILTADDRVELIDGEIVQMTPIGSRHAACVARLTALLSPAQPRAILWVQNPIRLGAHSEPQPDVTLLHPHPDFYAQAHPGPQDAVLVVEVAETSVDLDRQVKAPLYARAAIPELWLVDLAGEGIEVYRRPAPEGYQDARRLGRGQRLSPHAFPDLELAVSDILGSP